MTGRSLVKYHSRLSEHTYSLEREMQGLESAARRRDIVEAQVSWLLLAASWVRRLPSLGFCKKYRHVVWSVYWTGYRRVVFAMRPTSVPIPALIEIAGSHMPRNERNCRCHPSTRIVNAPAQIYLDHCFDTASLRCEMSNVTPIVTH